MNSENNRTGEIDLGTDREICELYHELIRAWNERDAATFAALFALDGVTIGFDGSLMTGTLEIEGSLTQIFRDHPTPPYYPKISSTRFVTDDCGILVAIAGMSPGCASAINPAFNARHSLVAVKRDGDWKIVHFQNTPAAFHGRPEMVASMTAELQVVKDSLKK